MATPVSSFDNWAIIVGGGGSVRFGGVTPKQFLPLGGRWIIEWSLDAFYSAASIHRFIVVVPDDYIEACRERWRRYEPKLAAVVGGGATRFESVSNGLALVPDDANCVLIHDAVRPGVTVELINRIAEAAERCGAALPVMPVHATVKAVKNERVVSTVGRERLRLAQTPQGFRLKWLQEGIARAGVEAEQATDEIQLVEGLPGGEIVVVEGLMQNEKITMAEDLKAIRALLVGDVSEIRSGIGYDAHRLVAGRALVLGGVRFDSPMGLQGHSDADVLCHAIADALLGAANLGDLGFHFPDSEPAWKDVSSIELLRRVASLLREQGWVIRVVDATLMLETPKVQSRRIEMTSNIAMALGVDSSVVSVKATTNEGLGFVGRGEGAAALASATIARELHC